MCVIHMALHSEDLNGIFATNFRHKLFETFFKAMDEKDLAPVPRTKDKVSVDQGNRGFSTTILILHVYFI